MRGRLAVLGLALACLAWHAFVTLGWRREATDLAQRYRELRESRRDLERRAAVLERREAAVSRLASGRSLDPAARVRGARRAVLGVLSSAPLRAVRLSVEPGRGDEPPQVRLFAEGETAEVMHVVDRLAGPEAGLVLVAVGLAAGEGEARRLDLRAHGGGTP